MVGADIHVPVRHTCVAGETVMCGETDIHVPACVVRKVAAAARMINSPGIAH